MTVERDSPTIETICETPEATQRLGELLARCVRAGDLIALVGPLGAGKTCLVAGLARGLGVEGRVASPSFIIARHHPGPVALVHADAYRLSAAEDLLDAGLDDWLAEAVVAVEWADRVAEVLPRDCLWVEIGFAAEGRKITARGRGPRGRRIAGCLKNALAGD